MSDTALRSVEAVASAIQSRCTARDPEFLNAQVCILADCVATLAGEVAKIQPAPPPLVNITPGMRREMQRVADATPGRGSARYEPRAGELAAYVRVLLKALPPEEEGK